MHKCASQVITAPAACIFTHSQTPEFVGELGSLAALAGSQLLYTFKKLEKPCRLGGFLFLEKPIRGRWSVPGSGSLHMWSAPSECLHAAALGGGKQIT